MQAAQGSGEVVAAGQAGAEGKSRRTPGPRGDDGGEFLLSAGLAEVARRLDQWPTPPVATYSLGGETAPSVNR